MIRGLYKTRDRLMGDCARVDWSAGDAAPVLRKDIYEALGGRPAFDQLPQRDSYLSRHTVDLDPFELA